MAPLLRGTESDMTSGHDPDKIDPTKQSGRPVMITGLFVGLILVLAVMALIYSLMR
ncbi:hypothetical protein GCM10023339_19170 [Alloalcanivorax gelatiniphagus]